MNRREFLAATLAVAAVPMAGPLTSVERQPLDLRTPLDLRGQVISATVDWDTKEGLRASTKWLGGGEWRFFPRPGETFEQLCERIVATFGLKDAHGWRGMSICRIDDDGKRHVDFRSEHRSYYLPGSSAEPKFETWYIPASEISPTDTYWASFDSGGATA